LHGADARLAGSGDPLFEVNTDRLANLPLYGAKKVGLDREFVAAVAEGHERALEGDAVHFASNLDKATRTKELD
jgi:hypothetical protein